MSEEGLDDLFGVFAEETAKVDDLIGSSENGFFIVGGEALICFGVLLGEGLVVGEGILKIVLILLILIHN